MTRQDRKEGTEYPLRRLARLRPVGLTIAVLIFLMKNQLSGAPLPLENTITVARTPDFEVTGDGLSTNWEQAVWIRMEQSGKGPAYQTQFKMLYSETGIYCVFLCEDTGITATLTKDFSDLWTEDVIEAFFWTDESTPMYFEYELSPLNVELPLLVPNFSSTTQEWKKTQGWLPWRYEGDRKTRHATKIRRDGENKVTGWTGEFFIPYALLKPLQNVPPVKGARWRANFYRIDYDQGGSQWCWQRIDKSFHEYWKYGTILFR